MIRIYITILLIGLLIDLNYANEKNALKLYKIASNALNEDIIQKQTSSNSHVLPFVTISFAQTLDGSIAPLARSRMNISSETSFKLLHSLRACHTGVLVGPKSLTSYKHGNTLVNINHSFSFSA